MMLRNIGWFGIGSLLLMGCSTGGVHSSPVSEPSVASELSSAPLEPPALPEPEPHSTPTVDASTFWYSGYSTTTGSNSGYFFESPSGKWRCAILEEFFGGVGVGCESVAGRVMPVKGAPLVPAADIPDDLVPPSSIVIKPNGSPEFIKLGQPYFVRPESPTPKLGYGQNLAALGYTCNTQKIGISCRNDRTGQGFTFSTEGYKFEYTPAAPAPAAPAADNTNSDVVLGAPSDQYSVGYGTPRPNGISTNSLCGNTINDISWESWGGPVAQGSGTWCQNSGAQSRGEPPRPVQLTASDIGECQGKIAYRTLQFDDQPPTPMCTA